MDPITVFQVTGTVVTFVEFSYNLISETRSIYRSPDDYATSQDIATDFQRTLTCLQANGTSEVEHVKTSLVISLKAIWSKDKLGERERLRGTKEDQELNAKINQLSKAVDRNNAQLDVFFEELDATTSKDDALGPARRRRLFSNLWDAN
ncbi:uncharacterized protein FFB20_05959 [Fusarium fujikuroi]|uniref:Fungal N-terminal domain-containing protein n=2 Tax=Fusarium fujikuroi TaxID=5127 RepID=S0E4E1_GIBF5|nr:uncharacterized protein FFUJ_05505 [Fusarium fujikuroi IMI 58289]KLO92942.1 uncharacterized protein LW93_4097 [Fusarium fujikuroi]KLP08494.1 uncharacterized protein Y057_13842 [Fusarium fujikuroi]KLP18723.1 uncharacterized protein LW94_1146 [Fusarium fujikuroi]QGI82680.1 hypothetical protein CEK25_009409 [Fusarium fujikuroi]CCT69606.1 uncharacterized protein FFUJ_05505 [Fusarium fujikuroi IMI 58289]